MKKTVLILTGISFCLGAFAATDNKQVVVDDVSKIDLIDENYIPEPDVVVCYKEVPEVLLKKAKPQASKKKKTKQEEAEFEDVEIVEDTVDAKGFQPTLRIYYPNGEKPTTPLPCAVFFGGGGWANAHPTQFSLVSRVIADLGMVGVFATYRTRNTMGKDAPDICVEDAKSAVRYVREHAQELGVNPDMIAAGGGSAGGHVAVAAACLDDFDCPTENLSISSRPNLLLLFNPVMDNSSDGYGHSRVKDIFPAISPFHNLKKDMPASVIFVGTLDTYCKVAMCEKYKEFLNDNGVDCEVHIYEGQKHGFFAHFRGRPMFIDTLKKMVTFLQKHKYLK